MSDIEIILKENNPVNPANPKSWHLSLPADVAVKYVLNALIPRLGLPTQQKNRQISYKLYHVKSKRTIPDDRTLENAGVAHNDLFLLLREQESPRAAKPVVSQPPRVKPQENLKTEERPGAVSMHFPPGLLYTNQHVWIDIASGMGHCGITAFLAQQIVAILEIELPVEGRSVRAGEVVCSLSALFFEPVDEIDMPVPSPVSGVISSVNAKLKDPLEEDLVWEDPYGEGWLFTIQLSKSAKNEIERLMNAEMYQQFLRSTGNL